MIWFKDPTVLYKNWYMIFPHLDFDSDQNVNAILRFTLLTGLLVSVWKKNIKELVGVVAVNVFTVVLYYLLNMKNSFSSVSNQKDKKSILENRLIKYNKKIENLKDNLMTVEDMKKAKTPDYLAFARQTYMPKKNCKYGSIFANNKQTTDCHGPEVSRKWSLRGNKDTLIS